MPEQIYIGNFAKGLKLDRTPFNIDNDSFPTLYNFYSWRGRVKRKRGTLFLGQLQIQTQSVVTATPPANWQIGTIATLDGSGNASVNLISVFSLPTSTTFTPGSFQLSDGTNTYKEPTTPNGTLVGTPGGVGTINYATGALTITGGAAGGTLVGKANVVSFSYFPGLPVMGLRDLVPGAPNVLYPLLLAFDTRKAYQINQASTPVFFYNVSFYKNSQNPVTWSGQDYQQFWTINYASALWATNNVPGFYFAKVHSVANQASTTITMVLWQQTTNNPITTLIDGDELWFNEGTASGGGAAWTLNGVTGVISDATGSGTGTYIVTFTSSQTVTGYNNDSAIAQVLTSQAAGSGYGDGIKWYDGDPTNGTGLPAMTGKGWVNFAPPLTAATVVIDTETAGKYYLVGALAIVSYKDRLLFFSPYIQTSAQAKAGTLPIQLQDAVIWSWNGTPYYSSFTPTGETFDPTAYYVDQTGKGGWTAVGTSQEIITVSNNEDALLVGLGGNVGRQTRLVYTGDDLYPFLFFNINQELGSAATFSSITLDRGALSIGVQGLILTTQQSAQRVDLDIPDSIFTIQGLNNGMPRVNAARDYFNEWIYFSYPVNDSLWKFPTQTFFYNYRDATWAIFYENFTAHGTYRATSSFTWGNCPFPTWSQWRETWNSGSTTALFPSVVAGNPQGYVLIIGQGTGEAKSGTIQAVASGTGGTQITSINHCVDEGDFLFIQGCLGTTFLNMQIGKVVSTADANTFVIDIPYVASTYGGLGTFTRLSLPFAQTKQFPVYWEQGRQVRLAAQKYLLDKTADAQITLYIFLSQDGNDAWNYGSIVPDTDPDPVNNSLIYSQILYTCPEKTNLSAPPANINEPNINLQMPISLNSQQQIWHRVNTSLIGDTFQIGFTLSDDTPGKKDAQMRNLDYATSEITIHGMHFTVDKGPHLA